MHIQRRWLPNSLQRPPALVAAVLLAPGEPVPAHQFVQVLAIDRRRPGSSRHIAAVTHEQRRHELSRAAPHVVVIGHWIDFVATFDLSLTAPPLVYARTANDHEPEPSPVTMYEVNAGLFTTAT